jgi:hypothetical protein
MTDVEARLVAGPLSLISEAAGAFDAGRLRQEV